MIEQKAVDIPLANGGTKQFLISKFPAVAGREIVAKYPLSAMPKLGDYAVNEETMLKLMAYVEVQTGDTKIALTTRALIDNHVPDWECLGRIELEMMQYNCSFFRNGSISSFFGNIAQKLPALITKILTDSLQPLSAKSKQP
jgi:hypothetical protein